MKNIYWTYRSERIEQPVYLPDWRSLNGWYTPSMYLPNQFADWFQAWLTNIKDNPIDEAKYTSELVPWIKKLTRLIIGEYNETYVDPIEFSRSITNVWARFNISMFNTLEETIIWIKANTNLVEKTHWVFILSEETTWMNWEIIPEQLLTIE